MKAFKEKAFYLLGIFMVLSLGACDMLDSSEEDSSSSDSYDYDQAIANVDYKNTNQRIYFDFSTGTMTEMDHDIWDLAISNSDCTVIANSGDYGYGVTVYKTSFTDITTDLSSYTDEVVDYEYTFEEFDDDGYIEANQTYANPFQDEFDGSGYGSGTVYIVQDEEGTCYKVTFSSFGPYGTYSLDVVTGLDGTVSTTITGYCDSDYDYIYFDLGSASAVSVAPELDSWDVIFARANYYSSATYLTGGSFILQNGEGSCEAAIAEDTEIEDLISYDDLTYDSAVSTMGRNWYTFDHDSYTYSVDTVTFTVKTTEGNYAKFQPLTFYGPDDESFYMTFDYYYETGTTGDFTY
ncbi:MAG: HmuY family protein [Spirochaetales bacterium]|nr:HmuY family protein [Spirochaetales bacterium]